MVHSNSNFYSSILFYLFYCTTGGHNTVECAPIQYRPTTVINQHLTGRVVNQFLKGNNMNLHKMCASQVSIYIPDSFYIYTLYYKQQTCIYYLCYPTRYTLRLALMGLKCELHCIFNDTFLKFDLFSK